MRVFILPLILLLAAVGCNRGEHRGIKPVYAPAVVADPEIEVIEKTFPEGFTGLVPKYRGKDSSCFDYLMIVKNGDLKSRYFFDEHCRLEEENHYDCSAMHGRQKRFYSNGQVKEALDMDHGVRQGYHIAYDSTGKMVASERWKNGKPAGPIKIYDTGGVVSYVSREHYRDVFRGE